MIDVTRIDHISMAVRDLDPQIELLERLFGFRYRSRFKQPGYVGAELEVPGRSGIAWEILAPDGPDSYLHRFLDSENGPGLHHVAMQVRDLPSTVEHMRSLGIEPWGYEPDPPPAADHEPAAPVLPDPTPRAPERTADGGPDAPPGSVAYIHPRGGGAGFLFQLYAGAPWHLPDPFEDERSDTLGITAINALSHAHYSRQELGDWYEQLFQFPTLHRTAVGLSETSFSSRILETPGAQLRFEVMQPIREDSFLQRFLDRRGPAIHHVSFEVRDLPRAILACNRNGVRVLGQRSGESQGARWSEAFLAPENTGGMLVQIFAWQSLDPVAAAQPLDEPAPAEPAVDAPGFEDDSADPSPIDPPEDAR
ncbi:MAG: VOC family protein [Chloroflexi bacterium]|nr:VOC family protein [Chloroflexota bacterium]MDA1147287.1 VOC family protein [Chloroflexota bacterium]